MKIKKSSTRFQKMIRRIIAFTCFLFSFGAIGQVNTQFVEHLSANSLKIEHWTYLNSFQHRSDSVNYFLSKYYLQYNSDSSFLATLNNCETIFMSDPKAVHFANQHFLGLANNYSDQWFKRFSVKSSELTGIPLIHYAAYHPNLIDITTISPNLQNDFLRLQRADRKHPFLAAGMSAIIPGSGKLYIGSPRSFLITFVSLSILGLQTWESYSKLGVRHPLTLLNGGLFSLYYVTNIFGSFRETKVKKQNRRKQFLLNATNHYTLTSPSVLY